MEIFLVLFLFSGQFKDFLLFFGLELPVDLTVLTAAFVVIITVYNVARKNSFVTSQISFGGIGLLLVFYAWMIFSLFYTPSESYSHEKTFYFLLNIAAFSAPFFAGNFNIRLFLKAFIIGALVLAAGLLPFQYFGMLGANSEPGIDGTYSAIGGLYLTLSEYLGLVVVLMLTKKAEIFHSKTVEVLVIVIVIGMMLLLGARGPLLFALLVYLLYYVSIQKRIRLAIKTKTLFWILGGSVAAIAAIFMMTRFDATNTLLMRSVSRFSVLVRWLISPDFQDSSSNVRVLLLKDAFDGIFQSLNSFLFGYGTGSFGIMTKGFDVRLYPHNLVLEIWFELGLIGLVLFGSWIFYVIFKLREFPNRWISFWMLLYIFLNLMKSSSLIDIRTEFALVALLIVQNFPEIKREAVATV